MEKPSAIAIAFSAVRPESTKTMAGFLQGQKVAAQRKGLKEKTTLAEVVAKGPVVKKEGPQTT